MKQTAEQLKEHYNLEVKLANRLKNSTFEERKTLYKDVYNELFSTIKHHPQNLIKASKKEQDAYVSPQISYINRFLNSNTVFVEIGPGDCALSFRVSEFVKQVYAVDVSNEITNSEKQPENFKLILSDGVSIPIKESVDVIYSNQLIEHLHEDDVKFQLQNIYQTLKLGGKYVCITPSRLSGPHDVSQYFDTVAKGFHLKEYTFLELFKMFKTIGFNKVYGYWGAKNKFVKIPSHIIIPVEKVISWFPRRFRKNRVFASLLNIRIVGVK